MPDPVSPPEIQVDEVPWLGTLYVGDHHRAAVVRAQASEVILCSSEDFERFVCMSRADFAGLIAKCGSR